jgi:hypothetical protein
MDTIEKQELAGRTRERNSLTWLSLDFGGLMAPLLTLETDLDVMAAPSIENCLAVSDEAWGIKEYQRDKTVELAQAEVDQELVIADAKAATGRAKIAIEMTTDEYVLAAKFYDAKVKSLIMGAKEYAALVDLEQLAVEEQRAYLAIDKEALRLVKIQADIYMETIQQAQVEAEIARAQVDVAKAHVRAAMSEIEAGKAEIELIEAEIQEYVAEAEKATLKADVAMILAEIMTKRLSTVKLDVGRKEILADYTYFQTKLDDALTLADIHKAIEDVRTESEVAIKEEVDLLLAVEKAEADLRNLEADYARLVFAYEEGQTEANIQEEAALKHSLVMARQRLSDAQLQLSINRDAKHTWAQTWLNTAHKWVHKHSQHGVTSYETNYEFISG